MQNIEVIQAGRSRCLRFEARINMTGWIEAKGVASGASEPQPRINIAWNASPSHNPCHCVSWPTNKPSVFVNNTIPNRLPSKRPLYHRQRSFSIQSRLRSPLTFDISFSLFAYTRNTRILHTSHSTRYTIAGDSMASTGKHRAPPCPSLSSPRRAAAPELPSCSLRCLYVMRPR